jgi:hypothetical protein
MKGACELSKEKIDIARVLATFSSQLEQRYRSPEAFGEEISKVLRSKKAKYGDSGYPEALEKNLVFLYFFVEELKSLLEIMITNLDDEGEFEKVDPGLTIMDIEEQLREETERKHAEIFADGGGSVFSGLDSGEDAAAYSENLEFHYSYLMAARSFAIDLINILYAARREYEIENAAFSRVWDYIDMSVNYYIGNISVGEKKGAE